jgi:hypothetical protein
LFCIFSVRSYSKKPHLAIAAAIIAVASLLVLFAFLKTARRLNPVKVMVEDVTSKNAEAMSYIVTYVIPFIDLPLDDWQNVVSLGVFFIMLGVIYVSTNMIHINPMLNIMWLHIHEIKTGGITHSLITHRRRIPENTEILVHRLGEDVMLEERK